MRYLRMAARTVLFILLTVASAAIAAPVLLVLKGRSGPGAAVMRMYSIAVLRLLGIRITVRGSTMPELGGCLILPNHIGFVDIFVASAVFKCWFVSKAEVRKYPVFGPMAELVGIIFLDRGSQADRLGLIRTLAREAGHRRIAVFPQGTTTSQDAPGPFNRGIFKAPELNPGITLLPVSIMFDRHREVHLGAKDTLLRNFLRMSALPRVNATVIVHEPVTGADYAAASVSEICKRVEDTVLAPLRM